MNGGGLGVFIHTVALLLSTGGELPRHDCDEPEPENDTVHRGDRFTNFFRNDKRSSGQEEGGPH